MRRALLAVIIAGAACAQTLIDPGHVSIALREFAPHPGDVPLRCEVVPTAPTLDFAFRFRAGYTFRLPAAQYQTAHHSWFVLTKITPQDGNRKPAYLFTRSTEAAIVKTNLKFEVTGSYLVGAGRYAVESTLYDDNSRTCKREWQINAALTRKERVVKPSQPPFTVRDLPGIRASDWKRPAGTGPITILLNAAPLSIRRTRMHPADRNLLLLALCAIVGRVPATSVRLVVFSLEEQKELFRSDNFSVNGLADVVKAIDSLELSTVDVSILQRPTGHVDLLVSLINQELHAPVPAGTVILLGPLSRFEGRIPEGSLETQSTGPHFFYVECRTVLRRIFVPDDGGASSGTDMPTTHSRPIGPSPGSQTSSTGSGGSGSSSSAPPPSHTSDPSDPSAVPHSGRGGRGIPPPAEMPPGQRDSDVIKAAVARLKGRTLVVQTPADLARAIARMRGER